MEAVAKRKIPTRAGNQTPDVQLVAQTQITSAGTCVFLEVGTEFVGTAYLRFVP
jgi:hypothetical protein